MCNTQNDDKTSYYQRINTVINDPLIKDIEKLKLVLLFSIRYEGDNLCIQLKDALRNVIKMDLELSLINHLLEYAGTKKRQGELFQKGSFFKKIKQNMNNVFMLENGAQNLFLQTRPQVATLCEQMQRGQLSQQLYPCTQAFDSKQPAQKIVVFIVGGATYCEAKALNELNNVVLGSTHMLSSKSFLKSL